MTLALYDRVQQTGTANTTVSFTLSGSVAGYQSFVAVGNGNTTYYGSFDTSGNWEVGLGTYSTTGPTLTRTTILSSSNGGLAVTFSGTVNVFITYPSEKSVNQDANGNVGIGTSTINSTSKLQIAGGGSGAIGAMRFSDGGLANYWDIGRDNGVVGNFTITGQGTQRMCIDTTGNVGIGTSSPVISGSAFTTLNVKGVSFNTALITATSNDLACSVQLYSGSASSDNPAIAFQKNLRIGTATDGGIGGFTERMRIDSSGNLMLGTSSALTTGLTLFNSNSAYSQLAITTNGVDGGFIGHDNEELLLNSNIKSNNTVLNTGRATSRIIINSGIGNSYIGFLTSGTTNNVSPTERMRIDANGYLLIGEQNALYTAANRNLIEINGTNESLIGLNINGAVGTYILQAGNNLSINNQKAGYTLFSTNATEAMRINSSQNVSIGSSAVFANARLNVVGNNGIFCNSQVNLTTSLTGIYSGAGGLIVMRDNLNGGTALILYENTIVIIVSQSGSNYTTGSPSGSQIQLTGTNVNTGSVGMSAKIATGTTVLNVGIFSCDDA